MATGFHKEEGAPTRIHLGAPNFQTFAVADPPSHRMPHTQPPLLVNDNVVIHIYVNYVHWNY